MKLLFRLLLSGLFLSPLFALAGRGVARPLPKPTTLNFHRAIEAKQAESNKAFNVRLSNLFCSAACTKVAERILSNDAKYNLRLDNVSPKNPAAIALIENIEAVSISLEFSGKNIEENLNALAFEIASENGWSMEPSLETQRAMARHITNIAEGMSKATAEKQQEYVDSYRKSSQKRI